MKFAAAAIAAAAIMGTTSALELTPDNWDTATAGKTAFIKFFAPWCGHCKKMKPDWDKLMKEYDGHDTVVVAEVDCTSSGKSLCDQNGVRGFPTIKHGDPTALDDYNGGRDYGEFAEFARNLKPVCSPANKDNCDEEGLAMIAKYEAMSEDELKAGIKEGEKKLEDAEENFKNEVGKLQTKYESLVEDKEAAIQAVKDSGLGMMKAVLATKSSKDEL